MSENPLDGKAALITGASAGIGRETARVLARDGASVALAARREERLRDLAGAIEDEFGVDTHLVPTDVSEEDQVEAMVDSTVDAFGGLDVVVSNAGVGGPGPVEEVPTEDYRRLMGVNVDGMFFVTRASLPHLRESNGNLIFVSSFAGEYPRPGNTIYAASKWWTRGFAYSLAGQVGGDGIAVSIVNPTEVRTEISGGDDLPMQDRFEPGEVTEPEDIAEAIGFAARQEPPNAATEIDLYRRDKFSHF